MGRDLGASSFEGDARHAQAIETWSDAGWSDALLRAVGPRNFEHWFRGRTTATCSTSDVEGAPAVTVTVGVSSTFFLTWMQKQFREPVLAAARTLLGEAAAVRFVVDPSLKSLDDSTSRAAVTARDVAASRHAERPDPSRSLRRTGSFGAGTSTASRSSLGPTRLAVVMPIPETSAKSVSATNGGGRPAERSRSEMAAARRPPFVASGVARTNRPSGRASFPSGDVMHGLANADSAEEPDGHIAANRTEPPRAAGLRIAAPSLTTSGTAPSERPKPEAGDAARLSRKLLDLADYVKGSGNELAVTAVHQVCDAPGTRVNPLFLYGGVGIGKTHLLEGICRRVRRSLSHLQIVLLSAETFANHFTDALRQRTLPAFRQRFRTVDVLLVDDVEFFEGKQVIQEEFLHTFKQLESQGRQIVVAADRHPRLLTRLSDELVSRLHSGLVCRIENPDLDTRRAIAVTKAARLEAEFAPEALTWVAQRFTNNVRELEGALHSLATWHAMTGRRITANAARTVLSDLERDCVKIVRVKDVEQTVCRFFGLATDDLRSSRRNRTLSQPRMLAMFLSRKLTQAAYSEIGQHFGGRNHSTVMSAERKVQEWLDAQTPIRVAAQSWPLNDLLETLERQVRAS